MGWVKWQPLIQHAISNYGRIVLWSGDFRTTQHRIIGYKLDARAATCFLFIFGKATFVIAFFLISLI